VIVVINDWLFRLVTKQRKMLTYHEGYFALKPLARRLYEIARAHCGAQDCVRFGIEKLRLRVGSTTTTNDFKKQLVSLSKTDKFPLLDYGFMIVDPRRLSATMPGEKPRGRTPIKAYQVLFFRRSASFVQALTNINAVPFMDDGGDVFSSSDDLDV
jgi:hypothetical protein